MRNSPKRIIHRAIEQHRIAVDHVTEKTIDLRSLGRSGPETFVNVRGVQSQRDIDTLHCIAKQNGFRITTTGALL